MNLNFIIKTPTEGLAVQVFRLISESLTYDIDSEPSQEVKESCVNLLTRVWGNMQPLYKNGLILIILYLNAHALLKHKKRFTNLSVPEISGIIKKWQTSKLAFKRDFIRFVFNLTLISYYDNKEVTGKLNIDRVAYLKTLSFYR